MLRLLLVSVVLSAGLISTALMYFAIKKREKRGATELAIAMLLISIAMFGYSGELLSNTIHGMMFWSYVQYIGLPFIPVVWLIMTAQLTDTGIILNKRIIILLFLIPTVTFFVHLSDSWFHFHYSSFNVNPHTIFPLLEYTKGWYYWIHIFYSMLLMIIGDIMLLLKWLRSIQPFRKQFSILLIGAFIPWIVELIYQIGGTFWPIDITFIGSLLTGIVFAVGIFNYKIFDLSPIARDMVFENIRDGVIILDTQRRIIDFNNAATSILPILNEKTIGEGINNVLSEYANILHSLDKDGKQITSLIIHDIKNNKSYFEAEISEIIDRKKHSSIGKIIVIKDITDHILITDKLKIQARHDYLTNLYNRMHFCTLSDDAIASTNNASKDIAFILMDIDHFKDVNDTYGHNAGDAILRMVADTFRNVLRPEDIYGRWGGEEFAFLIIGSSESEASAIAERIRQAIHETVVTYDAKPIHISASFGVASAQGSCLRDVDDLVRKADVSLYKAKSAGRNRVVSGGFNDNA